MTLSILDAIIRYNFIEVKLAGDVRDEEDTYIIPFLPRRRRLTIWDFERTFLSASENPRILGVLIKIESLRIGLARAETIRRSILQLREKGKRVFVYLESGGNIEYLIASAADKIIIPPWSMVNLLGLSAEVTFFKDALDKLGIEAEIKGLGEYKSAAEMFTRNTMSKPHKAMIDSLVDDLYSRFVEYVGAGRKIDQKKIMALIDSGPFTAQEALDAGLVDKLGYHGGLESGMEEELGQKIRRIGGRMYLRLVGVSEAVASMRERMTRGSGIIALVCDSGIITLGESRGGGGGSKTIGAETLMRRLERLENDAQVKAIVLRILSPGGSGVASDLLRNQIEMISRKKPVVVSMSDVAASGGYMMALGARKIVSESLSLTGSIGILFGKFNLENLIKKVGINKQMVSRGKRASIFSSFRGFTKSEEEKLASVMEAYYADFVQKVAEVRAMDLESAENAARGRVWTGKQARELGLVDHIGGIREAVLLAKKEAGMPDDVSPVVRLYSRPKSIQFSPFGRGFFMDDKLDFLWGSLRGLEREKILALMPFWVDFR